MNTQRTSGGSVTPALPRPTVRRKRVLVPPSPVEWSDPEEDNPDSCVYFLYSAGKIKIGTTTNIGYRHGALTGASPLPVYFMPIRLTPTDTHASIPLLTGDPAL